MKLKRVGLIDNLGDLHAFLDSGYESATAAEVMAATGGNTGNVAFVHGARKILRNPITRVEWNWTPDEVRQHADHLVICCANQIGRHADLGTWAEKLEQIQLPVTLLGLGAQSDDVKTLPDIPAGTRRFLDLVSQLRTESAPNIAVRGNFTRGVLEQVGVPSVAAGCPSLHTSPLRELGQMVLRRQSENAVRRVAVAAGNPWHGPSAALEPVLIDVVDNFCGEYVLQHPESMLQIAFGERATVKQATLDRFLNVYGGRFDLEGMFDWYRRHACVFIDAPNWMRFLGRFDIVIGPRYHGVALAIQFGVPGCVVTIDSRTEELCEGTGVKRIEVAEALRMTAAELVEASAWNTVDAERFDECRRTKANAYAEFLSANDLTASDHLLGLAAA